MSIKSFWRWFVGDDAPLGPESERGLFAHFNRPESLPWPPADGPIVSPRPKQFRPPVSDPAEQDYQWDSITGEHIVPKPRYPSGRDLVPCPAHLCGSDIGFCGLCGTAGAVTKEMADDYMRSKYPHITEAAPKPIAPAPRELKPTVGSILVPTLDGPPQRVPICHRPQRVEEAVFAGNIHPDLYEYIVHLEAHYARTAHHGE